jgi:hypothetical protein
MLLHARQGSQGSKEAITQKPVWDKGEAAIDAPDAIGSWRRSGRFVSACAHGLLHLPLTAAATHSRQSAAG